MEWSIRSGLVAALCAGLIVCAAAAGEAAGGEEIVFSSTIAGTADLWTIRPDGASRTNLSLVAHDPQGIFHERLPRWSPDGQRIAFVSNKSGTHKMWIMNADGSGDFEVTASPFDEYGPYWHPGGTTLYFARNPVGGGGCGPCPHWEILSHDLTAGAELQYTSDSSRDITTVVSPDGLRVAFAKAERPNDCCNPTDLWVMDADGGNQRELVPGSGAEGLYEFPSDWSALTGQILTAKQFGSSAVGAYEVVEVGLDGSVVRLTDNAVYEYPMAYSPEESHILFISQASGSFQLWIMDRDGSDPVQLTGAEPALQGADWGLADEDGDGVPDPTDRCPATAPGDVVDPTGCSIAQLCPCEAAAGGDAWANHGAYVSCVAHACEAFLALGLISEEEKDAIVSSAARSSCG